MNIVNRIKQYMKDNKITYEELCKLCKGEVSISTIKDIMRGKTVYPRPDTLKIIIKALGLQNESFNYFSDTSKNELPSNVYNEEVIAFPVIGMIKAGFGGSAVEDLTDEIQEVPVSLIKGHSKNDFMILRVDGNSMYPQFFDGDRVLVKKCDSVDSGSIAVILYNGDEATIKQVVYKNGEDWVDLIPRNPEYPPLRLVGNELSQCRILGQVIYLFRKI